MSRSARSNIRRLAAGRLISVTGGAAAYTALNFAVWDRTHDPFMQALSLLLTFGVAGIIGPLLGSLGDRFDRRHVMIWSEAIGAAFFFAMGSVDAPVLLILLAFGSAIADQPFYSASRAAIPSLAESDDDLAWANSLVTMGMHAGIAVGPVIGGLLVGISGGPSLVFVLNGVTFLVSLLLTLSVRAEFQERRTDETETEHGRFGAGVRFLLGEPVLRRMSIAWLVFVLGMGMGMVADAPLAIDTFDAGGLGFGLLIACWGTGSVMGTAAGRWMSARTEPLWMVWGAGGVTISALGVGLLPWFPLVLVALLAMGICDGLTIVAENGIMQRRTPDAVRSRTMSAFEGVLSLGLAAAYIAAGPVLSAVGAQPVYLIASVFGLGATFVLLPLLRLRREPGEPDGRVPEEAPSGIASEVISPG
jgi:MFS family permease